MASAWTRRAFVALRDSARVREIADVLLEARHTGCPLPDLDPALQPVGLEEAYAIQSAMAERLGALSGWKVGAPSPEATPLFCPMPLRFGLLSTGGALPGKTSRLRGVEAEIAFLVRRDLPVRERRYSRDEILEAVAGVYPAVEVLESAFRVPEQATHLATVADLQTNGGFVHGPACGDWQEVDMTREQLEVVVNGVVCWSGLGRNPGGPDLLRLVEYLVNEGQYRTGGLEVGQWITTGSWMGKLPAPASATVEVRFEHFGNVTFRFAQ